MGHICKYIFVRLVREKLLQSMEKSAKVISTHLKFDPTRVRTHDLQIMTVHFMSLRRLL